MPPLIPWPWPYVATCAYCERRRECRELVAAISSGFVIINACRRCAP